MKNFLQIILKTFIVDNAGHWVQQEKSKQTFKIMKNFYNLNKDNRF